MINWSHWKTFEVRENQGKFKLENNGHPVLNPMVKSEIEDEAHLLFYQPRYCQDFDDFSQI